MSKHPLRSNAALTRNPLSGRGRIGRIRALAVAGLALSLSALLLGAQCSPASEDLPPTLRAGACAIDITPVVGVNHTDPIYMAGFNNDFPATGVHDPLWARVLVLEMGDTKIALAALDLVGYFYNEVQTIRSLVDPALGFDSITVSSTHNHEGPDTMGLWGPDQTTSGVDVGYLDFVNDRVAECIREANARLEPAAIKIATGSTLGTSLPPWPDLVADGRVLDELVVDLTLVGGDEVVYVQGDDGPVTNPTLPVMQVRQFQQTGQGPLGGELGDVIATLTNFASHPESLGSNNSLITSDFPHFARQALEKKYGGVAIHVSADLGVLQGPLDVDLIDPATGQPAVRRSFRFAELMGEQLAEQAIYALEAEDEWQVQIDLLTETDGPIYLEVENPYFALFGTLGLFGRRQLMRIDGLPVVETETQVLRIGNAQIAVTPNELDPQIASLYRSAMTRADHHFVVGLGNDEIGYQMEQAKFNPSCFECWTYVLFDDPANCPLASTLDCDTVFQNNLGPGADPVLQSSLLGLIDGLNP